jgi:hypothetical protein
MGGRFRKIFGANSRRKPPIGPSNHSREAEGPGVNSFEKGQRPSHGLWCSHQCDRGCEHQT